MLSLAVHAVLTEYRYTRSQTRSNCRDRLEHASRVSTVSVPRGRIFSPLSRGTAPLRSGATVRSPASRSKEACRPKAARAAQSRTATRPGTILPRMETTSRNPRRLSSTANNSRAHRKLSSTTSRCTESTCRSSRRLSVRWPVQICSEPHRLTGLTLGTDFFERIRLINWIRQTVGCPTSSRIGSYADADSTAPRAVDPAPPRPERRLPARRRFPETRH